MTGPAAPAPYATSPYATSPDAPGSVVISSVLIGREPAGGVRNRTVTVVPRPPASGR